VSGDVPAIELARPKIDVGDQRSFPSDASSSSTAFSPDEAVAISKPPSARRRRQPIADLVHLRRDGGAEIMITAALHAPADPEMSAPHYGLGSDTRHGADVSQQATRTN
jgi:hypothetical protein